MSAIVINIDTSLTNVPTIEVGKQGENGATQVVFDVSEMVETYGSGTAYVVVQRRGDAEPYLLDNTSQSGNKVTWTVSNVDTDVYGTGRVQLFWLINEQVAKTVTYQFYVEEALHDPQDAPVVPGGWISDEIGNLDNLTTTAKANLVAAINEVNSKATTNTTAIGTLANLSTTEKSNLVGAINEVNEDVSDVKEDLDSVVDKHIPINYAENVKASDIVISGSNLIGKVVATDVANGISIVNNGGVNGNVAFPLNDLPYETQDNVIIDVIVSDGKSPITVSLYYGVSEGHYGTPYVDLTATEGKYTTTLHRLDTYDKATKGILYLVYNMRYNQTTPVVLTISAKKEGDTDRITVNPDALVDIDFNNLSDELYDAISTVSGEKPTQYGGMEICTFNKGVAIGDSLTAGVFNTHNDFVTKQAFSYPAKLSQITGVEVTNLGNGGYTSAQWYNNHASDDLSGYQFAIIQLGVNDALQNSGWTQESETAFTNIINKLLSENNGIFIFVSTIIPATSYSGTSFDSVSNGIRALVESIGNSHVILLDMALYGNTKTKTAYNNGHLSALGYERLALDYKSYISYVIEQNALLFRNIQFIGTNEIYP